MITTGVSDVKILNQMKFITFTLCLSVATSSYCANKTSPKTLHWGINLEPSQYFEIASLRFKNNVEARTNGQVKVKVSVSDYKQEDRDHLKDVSDGVYSMGQEIVNILSEKVPIFKLWEIPFLFENDNQVFEYTKTAFAKKSLRKLQEHGVYGIDYTYAGGFIHMIGQEINDITDLKSQKIYIEDATDYFKKSLLDKLNISTREYTTTIMKNLKNTTSELISSLLSELYQNHSKNDKTYLNVTNHRVFTRVVFINKDFLDSLTPINRKVVLEEAKIAAIMERELSLEASNNHLTNIKTNFKNIVINEWSSKQRAKSRSVFSHLYKQFEKKYKTSILKDIQKL